jgi:enoyl-CoA hydratase/carnithine racemase
VIRPPAVEVAVPSPLIIDRHEIDRGAIAILRMHRPEARNAMDSGMLTALVEALDGAASDADLRGLMLTGSEGVFSAGADLREPMPDGGRRRMELFTTFYEQLSMFPLPTAAAVEGPAVGGGAEAAAACDLRVVARSGRFRFPGAIHGIPVGTARTVGLVGLSTAKDWVLSSRDVPADEALRAGFAQRLVDDGAGEAVALEWLELVASRDPATVALLKRMFTDFGGVRDRVAYENDALRAQQETRALPDPDEDLPRTVRPRRR